MQSSKYSDYYSALNTKEIENVAEPDYSLIYYCHLNREVGNSCCLRTSYYSNLKPISVGQQFQTEIYSKTDKKIVEYVSIHTFEYVIKKIQSAVRSGLIAVKLVPGSLVLKTSVKGKYLATEINIISVDKKLDNRIFLDENFCRLLILQDTCNVKLAKNVTDDMIRYILEEYDSYALRWYISEKPELKSRLKKIKAQYKL